MRQPSYRPSNLSPGSAWVDLRRWRLMGSIAGTRVSDEGVSAGASLKVTRCFSDIISFFGFEKECFGGKKWEG